MNLFNAELCQHFKSKQVIKVITGLDNSDIDKILKIVKAAELSKVNYIDTIANPSIVSILKSISSLPICVSSINPIDLYNCVIAGADLVELGNFDSLYKRNIYLNSSDIFNLAKETLELVNNIDICVTIPYYLNWQEQIILAQKLENIGISILQTEGSPISKPYRNYNIITPKPNNYDNVFCSFNSSCLSLSSTYILSNHVKIPVITSSKINCLSSSMAMLYGASGIGIGSAISQINDLNNMYSYIEELRQSLYLINHQSSIIKNKAQNNLGSSIMI
uniref:Uncharacterized protein ycf23 n=1 Tax=Kuetzingia canaliculata TaxID=228262 RepID=A0A1Z1MP34_KUECA|nr:hypothetical protein [Kuetzingia canaliculata]ARW67818.1 hypothetical protein [Kuetzingia canaliculata]